jgi:hypothetical protein
LVDRRKQAKLQWLPEPSEANEGNLSEVRREDSGHFRNKKREYLKDEINKLESSSENKNIREFYADINKFKEVYQPRTNLVKDERGRPTCGSSQNFEQVEELLLSAVERTRGGWC